MRIANKGGAALTLLTLLLSTVAVANAEVLVGEPIQGFEGNKFINAVPSKPAPTPSLNATVYDNTASSPIFAVSSTDLNSQWGDELFTTNTGILSTLVFSLYNSGSSAGPLLTANVGVSLFDANTSALLGSFSTNVNFGAGLPTGFFSLITVTNLDPLLINLNVTDIIVIQAVTAKTGAANRLGIASLNPPTVGGSPNDMYINSLTVGPAGFYTFQNGPANPGYQIQVALPPVGTHPTSWGRVKKLYR
jgi:hypothetical protein